MSVPAANGPDTSPGASAQSAVAGPVNLILDLAVGLYPCDHRVCRRVGGRRGRRGFDPVEHGTQLRVQLGALLGGTGVLAFIAQRLVDESGLSRASFDQLDAFGCGAFANPPPTLWIFPLN